MLILLFSFIKGIIGSNSDSSSSISSRNWQQYKVKNCETSQLHTQLLCYVSEVTQVIKIILVTVPMHYMDQKSPVLFTVIMLRFVNQHRNYLSSESILREEVQNTARKNESRRKKKALPDSFDHAEPHFNTAVCVVLARFWEPWHTVVTIPQDLYPETMMLLCKKVSKRKKIFAYFFIILRWK